nr:unnamed protein product [Callosobruchus chinensis]
MIRCEVDAILIKVASLGLDIKHLGRSLSLMQPHLLAMHEKYGLNVCGEGGEYESLTLDCPLFVSRLVVKDSEVVIHSDDPIAPVGYLIFKKLELETKLPPLDLLDRLAGLPLKDSDGYVTDEGEEAFKSVENDADELACPENCNEEVYFAPPNIVQVATSGRSKQGWLWIGGVQGKSFLPLEAMEEATDILKCELDTFHHTVKDICSVTMFVSDMSQYSELNKTYVNTFNHSNPPSRACIQVPFDKDCPVRIEALSWKQTDSSGDNLYERNTIHVQSRSHWAPANIGPYSQSVSVRHTVLLAGQIGLVPGSMEMVKGGIKAECQLTLRHVTRLLKANNPSFNLRNVVQGICYITNISFVKEARKLWEEKTNNAIVDYVVVTGLPRNALIEWHVWAHKYNNQFDYEERGKCVDNYSITIYRRWNAENNISAILCHVDHPDSEAVFEERIFKEAMDYAIQKLKQDSEDETSVMNVKIFYSVQKNLSSSIFKGYFDNSTFQDVTLSYTLVPVVSLKTKQTFLSICGIRFP